MQRNNSSSPPYLITPIHTPVSTEDTTKISNSINPVLSISNMNTLSTPKRNIKPDTGIDNGIHTPISTPNLKNLYYVSNTTFTPKLALNSHQMAISTPLSTTMTTNSQASSSTSKTYSPFPKNNHNMLDPLSSSSGVATTIPNDATTSHQASTKGTTYDTSIVTFKSKMPTSSSNVPSDKMIRKNIKNHQVPRITMIPWIDRNTYVYQVEIGDKIVSRRFDNHLVNGTKLLNLAGLTRGKRDAILKNEPIRNVVKNAPFHLKGVWIPLERARILSYKFNIDNRIHYLLDNNPSKYIDDPNLWEINDWYLTYTKRFKKKYFPRP